MKENQTDESLSSGSCDRCGSWSAVGVKYYESYRILDKYDVLCTDCTEEENTHTAAEMDDEELIAAIMDDQLGMQVRLMRLPEVKTDE